MKVLVTGATGFIGKRLVRKLISLGHKVSILTRDKESAQIRLPLICDFHRWEPELYPPSSQAFNGVDAVVHLAGEIIADGRWSKERKKLIKDSRILSTRNLVSTLQSMVSPPSIFISSSAVGFYGKDKPVELYENLESGKDFLANVCKEWEHEAFVAKKSNIRTIALRIGIVLGYEGGAMKKMLPPFWVGAGGILGDGNQWMSWIHVNDLVGMITHSLENKEIEGVYNATSPEPVTNKEFTKYLAKALRRPALIPVPKFALKLILGEMSDLLLGSLKVSSVKIAESGYKFKFPDLTSALNNICKDSTNEIVVEHWLPLPIDKVFNFFKEPKNLEQITPGYLKFKVLNQSSDSIEEGTKINYKLSLHGIPMWWQSKLVDWKPNQKFSDTQTHGPYNHWYHTHEFEEKEGGTLIRDHVKYNLPLGIPGDCVAGSWVQKDLENIFDYRRKKIEKIFKNQVPASQ